MARSIVRSLLCYFVRARDHCCVLLLLGSLSNYDDNNNNNDDFKKAIGLMIKTTALHVHHAF